MAEAGSPCDFVRDVAIHFPLHVLMQILGVPVEDEPRMLKLTQELFASEDGELGGGLAAFGDPARHAKELFRLLGLFQDYFVPLMALRRDAPQHDLASVVANAAIDGRPIDHFEAVSYYVILAAAGHDTTSSSISGGVWALCENIDEFRKVKANPDLIPNLIHLSPQGRGRRASSDARRVRGLSAKSECVERPLTRSLRWRSGFDLSPAGRGSLSIHRPVPPSSNTATLPQALPDRC
jgi:cytochrome P450